MHTFLINNTIFCASCFGALHLNIYFNKFTTSIKVLPSSRNVPSAPEFKPKSGVIFVEKKLSSNLRYSVPKHFSVEFFSRP